MRALGMIGTLLVLLVLSTARAEPGAGTAGARPLSPLGPRFGNACQSRTVCAAMERLGLYAGLSLEGSLTETAQGPERAGGGTLSVGFDFIRRVAVEAHFPVAGLAAPGAAGDAAALSAGPLAVAARLRLGPAVPTLLSDKLPPRWAVVLGTQLAFRLPHTAGDARHFGALPLYAPQPSVHAGVELGLGPAQLAPSLGVLGEERAAYLLLGLRLGLRLAPGLGVDLEALSWLLAAVPDEPGPGARCRGGTAAGLGLRARLAPGVLGVAQYHAGAGDCEPRHRLALGLHFAFGEAPLRRIPTPEAAGVERLWLGMVDPVLDCNGWMLDEASLLPRFPFGEPVPGTDLIRRGEELFRIGEHFDIDRAGRLYRPHQYVPLADGRSFREARVREKRELPVCGVGPRHRFHEDCAQIEAALRTWEGYALVDKTMGWTGPAVTRYQLERRCLSDEEAEDPRALAEQLAAAMAGRGRGLRPAMAGPGSPGAPAAPPGARGSSPNLGAVEHSRPTTNTGAGSPAAALVVQKAPLKILEGDQGKHIEGHNNYKPDVQRSILKADPHELAKHAGTGQQVGPVPVGLPGSRERVDFGRFIGYRVIRGAGERIPTTKAIIHYAKDGIHIVPCDP